MPKVVGIKGTCSNHGCQCSTYDHDFFGYRTYPKLDTSMVRLPHRSDARISRAAKEMLSYSLQYCYSHFGTELNQGAW